MAMAFNASDSLVQAVGRLVDDRESTREPSHYDIGTVFERTKIAAGDPHNDPTAAKVGKRKRVTRTLRWALDHNEAATGAAVAALIDLIRGCGGFRAASPNYCGDEAIENCIAAFEGQPVELTKDGDLRPRSLAGLTGRELTGALRSYVARAQRGHADSVLVAGTDKDLIEAVAAHVLTERFGSYSQADFPTLLGQAFHAVGLIAQRPKQEAGGIQGARVAMSVALYELGCSVNRLRNKAGSGHGRPFLPELSSKEVRTATESVGVIAGALLDALDG